jgi:hypothetical protein
MAGVAIALVHHPVLDSKNEVVTTAITNLDVHDLARSATSYGVTDYFVAHPIAAQRELVERILSHWSEGSSGRRIPDRKVALEVVRVVTSLDEAIARLGGKDAVEVWVTAARDLASPKRLSFEDARAKIESGGKAVLIVFGTGWGLAPAVVDAADFALAPIRAARSAYNHLSVRAACAIALDRLLGAR